VETPEQREMVMRHCPQETERKSYIAFMKEKLLNIEAFIGK